MLFSTFLLSFQNENSPKGDLARDFIASKSRARTYLGIVKHLESHNADYSIQFYCF